jgi:hypothetical protein
VPTGALPDALREWCASVYTNADFHYRLAKLRGGLILPDGSTSTSWLDHCGMRERRLIEEAMRVGIFEVVE